MLGTDWSNYQPIPSQADCETLIAAGYTFAIVGLQDPDHGEAQAVVLRAFGITVEDCYIESLPNPRIPNGMKRGWVAVETGSGFVTENAIDAQLDWLWQHGLEAGIYTSPYQIALLGLTDAFEGKYAAVPRWIADYDDDPSTLAGAAVKQYSGDGHIPGLGYPVDLDFREDAHVPTYGPNQSKDLDLTVVMPNVETVAVGFEPPSQQWPKGRDVFEIRIARL